jgi:DNA polymerase-4
VAQLTLPIEPRSASALDTVLDRFGPAAVTRAVLLGRGPGLSAWLMPNDEPIPPGYSSSGQRP